MKRWHMSVKNLWPRDLNNFLTKQRALYTNSLFFHNLDVEVESWVGYGVHGYISQPWPALALGCPSLRPLIEDHWSRSNHLGYVWWKCSLVLKITFLVAPVTRHVVSHNKAILLRHLVRFVFEVRWSIHLGRRDSTDRTVVKINAGQSGVTTTKCTILFACGSRTSQCGCTTAFLQCLWLHCPLHLPSLRCTFLLLSMSNIAYWHPLSKVFSLVLSNSFVPP